MLEFAVLLHLKRGSENKISRLISSQTFKPHHNNESSTKKLVDASGKEKGIEVLLDQGKPTNFADDAIKKERTVFLYRTKRIDYTSLIVSLVMFCVFNCTYWMYFLRF